MADITAEVLAEAEAFLVSTGHSMDAIADGWGIDARTLASFALQHNFGLDPGTANAIVGTLAHFRTYTNAGVEWGPEDVQAYAAYNFSAVDVHGIGGG